MAKITDAEETEVQEAAIWKRRGERSQTGGDVVMEGASDGERLKKDYDSLVSQRVINYQKLIFYLHLFTFLDRKSTAKLCK